MTRTYKETKRTVYNRGAAPDIFLDELVEWGRKAPDEIFAPNNRYDIYNKASHELGPWTDLIHRKAVMLEVLRCLAAFESSFDWNEGIDTSRASRDTPENSEAGAWQVSYDARHIAPELKAFLIANRIADGLKFQREMKVNHELAMEFITRALRYSTKMNGPLYRGDERRNTWPNRPRLWDEKESIYPWLNREAVGEFRGFLS